VKAWGREAWVVVNDLEVRGLRLVFKVKSTLKPDPNDLDLRIYNLSPTTRAKLSAAAAAPVVLVAGHQGTAQVIFSGRARTVDHLRDGASWVTHVQSGDGNQAFTKLSAISFAAGTRATDVAIALAKDLGVEAGDAIARLRRGDFTGAREVFLQGFSASGRSVRDFDRVAKVLGLEWSIQGGVLQLLEPGKGTQEAAYELAPDTGLIGSPDHGAPGPNGEPPLLKVKCLLNGGIRPGRVVSLRSSARSGFYVVDQVEHAGDTHGASEWTTSLEARPR